MAIDYTKAHEFDNGLQFSEGNWLGGGELSPLSTGLPAPEGALYVQSDGIIWRKVGPLDNDWEIRAVGDPSATQTMDFGKGGTATSGSFLYRAGSVPSNVVGLPVLLNASRIVVVQAGNENTITAVIEIYESEPNFVNPTLLYTLDFNNTNIAGTSGLSVPATKGRFISTKIDGANFKNTGMTIGLKGLSI